MRRTHWCCVAAALATALAAVTTAAFAQARRDAVTVVSGTLVGADGRAMQRADVELRDPVRPGHGARAEVAPDGRFAIATTEPGMYLVRFTGVGHAPATIPLVLEPPAMVAVDVRLARIAYTDSLDKVAAVGDWNGFSPATAKPLVRQADGRYTLDVTSEADTVSYQLLGLDAANGRRNLANGSQAGGYATDGAGHYRTIIRADNGHARIVLDPSQLDRRPSRLAVTFRVPTSPAARQHALNHEWDEVRQAYVDTSRARRLRHDSTSYDWAPAVTRRTVLLARERHPILRQVLLLQLLDAAQLGAAIPRAVAQRIMAEVRPASPLWLDPIRTPWMIQQAFQLAEGDTGDVADTAASRVTLAYLDSVIAEQPDSNLQVMALFGALRLARRAKDAARTNDYYTRLVTDYPYSSFTAYIKMQMAPGRAWRVGVAAPEFSLPALDDTAMTYTPATFAGKVVLIDFWATWCLPCLAEMPYLQAAYDSLGSRGLEILSVSLDQTPMAVRRFRAGRWKMPWLQAYAAGGFDNPRLRQLEIAFVPRVFLVGRDGKIVAVDAGLRGDSLLPTLRRGTRFGATIGTQGLPGTPK